MAVFGVWRNGTITVNGTDLSDHAREITLETSLEELADNVHGDNTNKVRAGLENWTISVTFLQDFAASEVDATLDAINGVGQAGVNVIVGADAAAVSTTNPRYSGSAILASYRPFGGQHGVNLEANAVFRAAGNLTRQTV